MSVFQAKDLCTGYVNKNSKTNIHVDLNFTVNKGQFIALVGPNGSGKSTLLRTLSKFLPPISGELLLDGANINSISIQELSKLISIVITEPIHTSELKVIEIVETARFPYSSFIRNYSQKDRAIVENSIKSVGLVNFENRRINTLSDGELQRVLIARALCQQTDIILLDEPTSHLDIENRYSIISLLKKIAHEEKKTIVFSTHELDLAFQTADILWLFNSQKEFFVGTPEDLILSGNFDSIFQNDKLEFKKSEGRFVYKHDLFIPVNIIAKNADVYFWTKNALERIGFFVSSQEETITIEIPASSLIWKVYVNTTSYKCCNSIESLLSCCKELIQKIKE